MTAPDLANTAFFSGLLPARHPTLCRRVRKILARHGISVRLIPGTRDIWCRDYMPVQVGRGRFVQFAYRPDYLADTPELITGPDAAARLGLPGVCIQSSIVLDGGNVVRRDDKAIVTDKVFRENPLVPGDQLVARLRVELAVAKLLVIPAEPGDITGHADGVVRFVDSATVLVNDYRAADRAYGRELRRILAAAGLHCVRLLYEPSSKVVHGMPSAVGNYMNFLQTPGVFIVPSYSPIDDIVAHEMVRRAFNYPAIESVDCRGLAREGGVLNCVSWQLTAIPAREPAARGDGVRSQPTVPPRPAALH